MDPPQRHRRTGAGPPPLLHRRTDSEGWKKPGGEIIKVMKVTNIPDSLIAMSLVKDLSIPTYFAAESITVSWPLRLDLDSS